MNGCRLFVLSMLVLVCELGVAPRAQVAPAVTVSGSCFVRDGQPFFYLADTAWILFEKLTRKRDIDHYMADRQAKGFTVIQTAAVLIFGHAFTNEDPTQPIEKYWNRVDYAMESARSRGLVVAMVPIWANHVIPTGQLTVTKAEQFGLFLGQRYANEPIIWMLGGDHVAIGSEKIYAALARGITVGVAGSENYAATLMTDHPYFWYSSADFFPADPWMDFDTFQSGHNTLAFSYHLANHTLAVNGGLRPMLDSEPGYEHIPSDLTAGNPLITAYDVRKFAYQSVLAGSCGHTYGANEVFMFWSPGDENWGAEVWGASVPWKQALHFPGAVQMGYLRTLVQSVPFASLVPDQSLLASDEMEGDQRIQVARTGTGSHALVYDTAGLPFSIHLVALGPAKNGFNAAWFDPRTGSIVDEADVFGAKASFSAPSAEDWVLVLTRN